MGRPITSKFFSCRYQPSGYTHRYLGRLLRWCWEFLNCTCRLQQQKQQKQQQRQQQYGMLCKFASEHVEGLGYLNPRLAVRAIHCRSWLHPVEQSPSPTLWYLGRHARMRNGRQIRAIIGPRLRPHQGCGPGSHWRPPAPKNSPACLLGTMWHQVSCARGT